MRKTVNLKQIINTVIIVLTALFILTVWPGKVYKETKIDTTLRTTNERSEVLNYRNVAMQAFVANHEHLDSVRIHIASCLPNNFVTVILSDSKGKELAREDVDDVGVVEYMDILMDVDTVPGEVYFVKVFSIKSMCLEEEAFNPESGVIAMAYFNNEVLDGRNYIIDYVCKDDLGTKKMLLLIGSAVLLAVILILIVNKVFKNSKVLMSVEKAMKIILNPLAGLLILASLGFVISGKAAPYMLDSIVMGVSIILLGIILFYGINHNRLGDEPIFTREYLKSHFSSLVQSVAIAGALQACAEYVSGFYTIDHQVAERKQMLWFALIIIAMYSFREIVNVVNLVYLVLAAGVGFYYYKAAFPAEGSPDDIFVLRGTVIIAILLGFILLRTVIRLVKTRLPKPDIIYAIILVLYFAFTIIFRNTRFWPVTLAVCFILLMLNYGTWDKKEYFVMNVIRGVVIQFIYSTLWCWLYRPYDNNGNVRYTHMFHTSTITATYLTMIMIVVTVLYLTKISKCYLTKGEEKMSEGKVLLKDVWKELVLFGVAAAYLIFTIARTAYAASLVAVAAAFIIMYCIYGKRSFKITVQAFGLAVAAVIVLFPVTFTVQRTIPGLVSDPFVYDIDNYSDHVLRGRNLDSKDYITVGRIVEIFSDKILGIDERSFNFYEEKTYDYSDYHSTAKEAYIRAYTKWDNVDMTDEDWDKIFWDDPILQCAYIDKDIDFRGIKDASELPKAYEKANEKSKEPATSEGEPDATKDAINSMFVFTDNQNVSTEPEDYTNGRIDIYKSYIEQLNMTGHDTMGAILKNGEEATHAHDVYLQVAFDHGIPTAVIFILFGMITFIAGLRFYKENKINAPEKLLTVVMLIGFAVAGIVEWTYHLSHPMAFVLWLSVSPLVFNRKVRNETK